MERFINRRQAGQFLAQRLARYADSADVTVLALPRGGVPVAYEIAHLLHVPLDVLVVRKIGAPWNEELAVGAVASGGTRILDLPLIQQMRIHPGDIEQIIADEMRELARRERVYREGRPWPDLRGRRVILVDDGLATGASMRAAVNAVRRQSPRQVIVATPVASVDAYHAMRAIADACVALLIPESLYGVGMYYQDFSQTTDDEVVTLLRQAAQETIPTSVRTLASADAS